MQSDLDGHGSGWRHSATQRDLGFATEVRRVVLRAIDELADPSWSFIFTLYAKQSEELKADGVVAELHTLAAAKGAEFRVIRLVCDQEELARRIGSADRKARMKMTGVELLDQSIANEEVFEPTHAPCLTIDVSKRAPEATVAVILANS